MYVYRYKRYVLVYSVVCIVVVYACSVMRMV
jgi:hypothetical protein